MLEYVPSWLGHALRGLRAGADKLVIVEPGLGEGFATLDLSSPAFAQGGRIPERYTADGVGVSPPLVWSGVPDTATSLVLIVEDPDAPAPQPLVHAIVWGIEPGPGGMAEGAIVPGGAGERPGAASTSTDQTRDVGRNSYMREGWLPPDPPAGHGAHHYAFQLFALTGSADPGGTPGRGAIVAAMRGRVLAAGLLVGTYSRGEQSPAGSVPAGASLA